MSRKGKLPIPVPKGVEVKNAAGELTVKGPKGTLKEALPPAIELEIGENELVVKVKGTAEGTNALHGLYRQLINNMVVGTSVGFTKKLEMIGVGYRAAVKGNQLDVQVGLSHPSLLAIPEGLTVSVEKNTVITIAGIDKRGVGQFAADVRSLRPPEPYKGKGIRYEGEYVRKKAGKSASR